jgi:O-acetylhomoserine/O-acetylserine sulfhydrylase-like pyridoxal-dependent enzyme
MQMGEAQLIAASMPPDLARPSAGLETLDDILRDLD